MDNPLLDAHREIAQQAYDKLEIVVWTVNGGFAVLVAVWILWKLMCGFCDLVMRNS